MHLLVYYWNSWILCLSRGNCWYLFVSINRLSKYSCYCTAAHSTCCTLHFSLLCLQCSWRFVEVMLLKTFMNDVSVASILMEIIPRRLGPLKIKIKTLIEVRYKENIDCAVLKGLPSIHTFAKTFQSFGAWSCMRYSCPLDRFLIIRWSSSIVSQHESRSSCLTYDMRLVYPLSILPALPSHKTRCFIGWSSHR